MLWCRTLGESALYTDPSCETTLLRAGKATALLAYLGLHPRRREHRDRLVELFWPGTANGNGRHALRQTLYRLPQAPDDEALTDADETIVRLTGPVSFDCVEGERALGKGDYERAFQLLRGPFLPGLGFPVSGDLAEWIEAQDARFRAGFTRAAAALIGHAFQAGDPRRAATIAEELVSLNPIDDERVRVLMEAFDRSGQARQALARYAEYTQRLRVDNGDEPPAELQTYARELEQSLDLAPQEASHVLPFVGRYEAWALLDRAWAEVESGRSATVLVEGDGGLGKTRLVDEFARRVTARGAVHLSGKCYEIEATLPYALIGDLLRSAETADLLPRPPQLKGVEHPPAAPILPDLRSNGAGNGDITLREDLVRWLGNAAATRPLMLTCDDVHWADEGSLRLLHPLTHRLTGSRVLIVCSYRPLELTTAARRFALSLIGEDLARLVTLRPFSVDEVREILTSMGIFDPEALGVRLAEELHRHTDGNPLFLAELLEALASRGDLTRQDGRWETSHELDSAALPKTIKKILADRVDALAPRLRDVLELVAVAADAVEADVAARALGLSEPAAQAAFAELGRTRLVRSERSGRWAAGHDDLCQLVHASIPDDRMRRLHGAIGTALLERGIDSPAAAARLAHHFEQAGDAARARQFAVLAAGQAGAVGAVEARRELLARAEALAMGTRRAGVAATGPSSKRRRRPLHAAAIAAAMLAVSAWLGGQLFRGHAPAYAQGSFYLVAERHTDRGTASSQVYRLRWPRRYDDTARLGTVPGWPAALPPRLATAFQRANGKTQGRVFRIGDTDSMQLTFGPTDDGPAVWGPDRRVILVQKGWRTGDEYRFNLVVVDTVGHELWRVTEGPYEDGLLDWSPDGSRVAFRRVSKGRWTLMVTDADGQRPLNVTEAFGLGDAQMTVASFAAGASRLAVAHDSSVSILDLDRRSRQPLAIHCQGVRLLAWSPDGRWLMAPCRRGTRDVLLAIATDEPSTAHTLLTLPAGLVYGSAAWLGRRAQYVAGVSLQVESVTVAAGHGRQIRVSALTESGSPAATSIRWSVGDTSLASVDENGFLRGQRPGITRLVASAGGFRADTALLTVLPSRNDTLLAETWDAGIDPKRWEVVGEPSPTVTPGAGPGGAGAFLSNGDDSWPSGVLSVAEFDVADGLTFEFSAWFRLTGGHWQELEAALVPRAAAVMAGERTVKRRVASWWVTGPSPHYATGVYSCGPDAGTIFREGVSSDHLEGRWRRFALQVRPDGYVECYLDGERVAVLEIPEATRAERLSVYLGGRTNKTRIYHGPVLVTRGLRY